MRSKETRKKCKIKVYDKDQVKKTVLHKQYKCTSIKQKDKQLFDITIWPKFAVYTSFLLKIICRKKVIEGLNHWSFIPITVKYILMRKSQV